MIKTKNEGAETSIALCDSLCEDIEDLRAALETCSCDLPYWWTNKLAVSAAYINSLRDYLLFYSPIEDTEETSDMEDGSEEDDMSEELDSIIDSPVEQEEDDMLPPSARIMKNAAKKG